MSLINCQIISKDTDARAYHAAKNAVKRGDPKFAMSPSSLREFGQCPERWFRGYSSPDSEAKAWGSLLDCRLLTPGQFLDHYAVRPEKYHHHAMQCPNCQSITDSKSCRRCALDRVPVVVEKDWDGNATFCRDWKDRQEGHEIVSKDDLESCNEAINRLMSDEIICAFVDASDRQVLVRGEWHDEKTGLVIPVECLIDLVPRIETEFAKNLGDLKSTRNAALMPWQRWCFQAGYHIQAAFDLALYVAATGEDRNSWCFIVQENFSPWQTAKRLLSQDFLALGTSEFGRLLENYCACLKSGRWPGYDDTDEAVQNWSIVEAEPFMAERAAFAPRFNFEDSDEVAETEQ